MTGAESDSAEPANPTPEVPFDGGCAGVLFGLMVPCAIVFCLAAFNTEFAEILDNQTRRGLVGVFRIGPIDFGALVLGGIATWQAVKSMRRFVDMRAVWIDGDVIRFHPTVRRRSLPLRALESVNHEAGDIKSILWFHHDGGKRIKVAMVDHDAAANFALDVEQAKAASTFG
jgi:hypothetical protein